MAAPDAVITPSWGTVYGGHVFNIPAEGNQAYSGGEFDVTVSQWNYAYAYVHTAKRPQANGFATFCVQTEQDFAPGLGSPHNVTISNHTNNGTNRPLQATTAYLYHQFNAGTLSNYNWSASGYIGDNNRTSDLMGLFWYLQHEPYYMDPAYDTKIALTAQQQAWKTEAETAISTGAWKGMGGVRVMQLHGRNPDGSNGAAAQDLLVELNTPEPTTLALLAIGGLPVLPLIRRRRSA